jgi:hypothetical protein
MRAIDSTKRINRNIIKKLRSLLCGFASFENHGPFAPPVQGVFPGHDFQVAQKSRFFILVGTTPPIPACLPRGDRARTNSIFLLDTGGTMRLRRRIKKGGGELFFRESLSAPPAEKRTVKKGGSGNG